VNRVDQVNRAVEAKRVDQVNRAVEAKRVDQVNRVDQVKMSLMSPCHSDMTKW
jgi:hypothetical protein